MSRIDETGRLFGDMDWNGYYSSNDVIIVNRLALDPDHVDQYLSKSASCFDGI